METIQSVGIREFRSNLYKYTRQVGEPIAITSHGEAIGYYIPAKLDPSQQDLVNLQEALRQLVAVLAANGVSEEEILTDFKAARS